ncbi:hypothetical protein D3OALGB2SA_453 [Olavius algarvensis associated proteobacterium Delta 3]|nr:hypothetical protein D3OALGB2SA_453 [Olavius algarvensis associated proteobacterium Delta 3]
MCPSTGLPVCRLAGGTRHVQTSGSFICPARWELIRCSSTFYRITISNFRLANNAFDRQTGKPENRPTLDNAAKPVITR